MQKEHIVLYIYDIIKKSKAYYIPAKNYIASLLDAYCIYIIIKGSEVIAVHLLQ